MRTRKSRPAGHRQTAVVTDKTHAGSLPSLPALRLALHQATPPLAYAEKTKGLARGAKPLILMVLLTGIELVTY